MQDSTVDVNGRTTLPKDVRAALDPKPGNRVRYLIDGGDVRILKVRSVAELAGLLPRPERPAVTLEEMDTAIAAATAGPDPAA